ncbi:MAG: hypothetical protein EBT03_10570 [Betaproteobacteria bacterium]|nr:hypothetical protein [Betaproteobacteria bacterium]
MNWNRQTKIKLALEIQKISRATQEEVFNEARGNLVSFVECVDKTIERIMSRLGPLGFEPANKDWRHEEGGKVTIYKDSPTHLWFEIAQARVVKIKKSLAERVLVLGIP